MYPWAFVVSITVLALSTLIGFMSTMSSDLGEKSNRIKQLEIENKLLVESKKGECDEKKREDEIKDSNSDANGTVYNWVFLKNR